VPTEMWVCGILREQNSAAAASIFVTITSCSPPTGFDVWNYFWGFRCAHRDVICRSCRQQNSAAAASIFVTITSCSPPTGFDVWNYFLGCRCGHRDVGMSKLSAIKFGCSGVNIRDDHFGFATHRFRGVELFFGALDVPKGMWYVEVVGNKIRLQRRQYL